MFFFFQITFFILEWFYIYGIVAKKVHGVPRWQKVSDSDSNDFKSQFCNLLLYPWTHYLNTHILGYGFLNFKMAPKLYVLGSSMCLISISTYNLYGWYICFKKLMQITHYNNCKWPMFSNDNFSSSKYKFHSLPYLSSFFRQLMELLALTSI